jgi:hypothetical protein
MERLATGLGRRAEVPLQQQRLFFSDLRLNQQGNPGSPVDGAQGFAKKADRMAL